jgi:hypothetical protein
MRMDSQQPLLAQFLALVALGVALLPLGAQGYYVLLHFIISAACIYLAVCSYRLGRHNWAWVLGALAVLYNPFIPVHLDQEVWVVSNVIAFFIIGASIRKLRRQSERMPQSDTSTASYNPSEFEVDSARYTFDPDLRILRGPEGSVYRVLGTSRPGPGKLTVSAETPTGAVFKITLRGLESERETTRVERRECKRCGKIKSTQSVFFIENISYFFARRERTFHGHVCFPCMTKTFATFETRTLLGTWWGIIGIICGPGYLVENLVEYVKHSYRFMRSK